MAGATDRIRLRCHFCEGSEWDVWGDFHGMQFDPEDGIDALRCPGCLVVCDQVVEINGTPVPGVD